MSEKSNTFDNKIGANDAAAGAATATVTVAANIVTTTSTTTETFTEDADNEESECDSKSAGEPCVSTVETYDNYLGDESGKFSHPTSTAASNISMSLFSSLQSDEKARIQLRLPTSDRHIFEWPCTTKLKALKLYIAFKYPELTNDPYKVICPFVGGQSTNNILEMDDTLTLKEANLYPTAILHLRNED